MKLFLIRHGETRWEKRGFLSHTDLNLTKNGIAQAEKIALKLKKNNIDTIYSSPLKRAKQTADIIGKYLGLEVIVAPQLREVDFGIFEGLTLEEAEKEYPRLYHQRQRDKWNFRVPKGESYKDASDRVLKLLGEIFRTNNKNVALVTHVTIIKILLRLFSNLPMEEIDKIHFLHTSLTVFDKKGQKIRVLRINDSSHL